PRARHRAPTGSPLVPYTTLFRSAPAEKGRGGAGPRLRPGQRQGPPGAGRPPAGRRRRIRRPVPPADRHGPVGAAGAGGPAAGVGDRKSTRLNSSHVSISYAVFCL